MASYVRCLFCILLALSFSLQIRARESHFFSKVSKTTTKIYDSISISPTLSPSLVPAPALSPEPEVVEHGYGLYGRNPYENTHDDTIEPTEKPVFGEEKYIPAEELYKENTSENLEAGFSNNNFNGNGNNKFQYPPTTQKSAKIPTVGEEKYVSTEKKGMSDTRFLENGKFYYDVNQDGKDVNSYVENKGNEKEDENEKGYVVEKEGLSEATYRTVNGNGREKQGMSDTRFLENGKYYYDVNQDGKDVSSFVENEQNVNWRNGYVKEKQGMSDTRFMENGKYFHDVQNEEGFKGEENDQLNSNNIKNEQFYEDNHGMSDTRFSDNGKYYYDVNNENGNHNNLYNNKNSNWNGNGNGNEGEHYEGNKEYASKGRKDNYGSTKKLPNEYDTIEEYDREQGYVDPQDGYVP